MEGLRGFKDIRGWGSGVGRKRSWLAVSPKVKVEGGVGIRAEEDRFEKEKDCGRETGKAVRESDRVGADGAGIGAEGLAGGSEREGAVGAVLGGGGIISSGASSSVS